MSEESAHSRLVGAGFASTMGTFWLSPGGHRVLTLEQALAELNSDKDADAA